MKLLIATTNQGKITEVTTLLKDLPLTILSLADVGLSNYQVAETGPTFADNALIKAQAYAQKSGLLTLADDSGLEVDALDGRPGVHSARYSETPESRNQKLLSELKSIPDSQRTARFKIAVCLFDPLKNKSYLAEAQVEGQITKKPMGDHGFGYDPVFYSTDLKKTFAQASEAEKNSISHRGQALREIKKILTKLL